MRKPGYTFYFANIRIVLLFSSGGGDSRSGDGGSGDDHFHYVNLSTDSTHVGMKSLLPDQDITKPIDRSNRRVSYYTILSTVF